jgi:hypothetical protein
MSADLEKTAYSTTVSRHPTAGHYRNMKVANRPFEYTKRFKYLGVRVKIRIVFVKELTAD